jgi:hypothetical protein
MGAVFVSNNGERWRSIALDDGVGAADTSEPAGVAIGPRGLLAYGGVCCTAEERAIWESQDGIRWVRIPVGGDFDPARSWPARIIGTDDGWMAVGQDGERAAIWISADGRIWERVGPVDGELGIGLASDVAPFGAGFVAVGTVDDAASTHDGAIWLSDDGTSWTRSGERDPGLVGPDETELSRVLPFARGLFVVGNHGSHEERVKCEQLLGVMASLDAAPPPSETARSCGWGREHHWLSADGNRWQRLPPLDPLPGQPQPPGLRPLEFRLIAAGGPGIVNLAEDNQAPDGDSGIWLSADGSAWQLLDAPTQLEPAALQMGVASLDDRIVAVGERSDPDGSSTPAIWIGLTR